MWYIVVVPDSEPNADGVTVDILDSVCIDGLSFSAMCEVLAEFVPPRHHIVKVGRRL
jgi:hypothetical protein